MDFSDFETDLNEVNTCPICGLAYRGNKCPDCKDIDTKIEGLISHRGWNTQEQSN